MVCQESGAHWAEVTTPANSKTRNSQSLYYILYSNSEFAMSKFA